MHASGINLRSGITAPFVLWLIAGLVPWFFFQEVLSGGTNALMEYSYLDEIYNIATTKLGMVYSQPGQTLYYSQNNDDYVVQYKDVPKAK